MRKPQLKHQHIIKLGRLLDMLYNLEDVLKIARVSTETLRQERGKIAVCMLFLSGMRAEALASLPISCVDLSAGEIAQLPEAGVRTKNRKAAITFLVYGNLIHNDVKNIIGSLTADH